MMNLKLKFQLVEKTEAENARRGCSLEYMYVGMYSTCEKCMHSWMSDKTTVFPEIKRGDIRG